MHFIKRALLLIVQELYSYQIFRC